MPCLARWLPEDAELAHYHFDLPEALTASLDQPPSENASAQVEGSQPDMLQAQVTSMTGALSADDSEEKQLSTASNRKAFIMA